MRCVPRPRLRWDWSHSCDRCLMLSSASPRVPYVLVHATIFHSLLATHTKVPYTLGCFIPFLGRLFPRVVSFLTVYFIVHIVARVSPLSSISCIHMSSPLHWQRERVPMLICPPSKCFNASHVQMPCSAFVLSLLVIVAAVHASTLYDIPDLSEFNTWLGMPSARTRTR